MQWVENAVRDFEVSYPEDGISDVDCAELAKKHCKKIRRWRTCLFSAWKSIG
jgi:hypothetical protein